MKQQHMFYLYLILQLFHNPAICMQINLKLLEKIHFALVTEMRLEEKTDFMQRCVESEKGYNSFTCYYLSKMTQLTALLFASAATTPAHKAETTLIRTLTYKQKMIWITISLLLSMLVCNVIIIFVTAIAIVSVSTSINLNRFHSFLLISLVQEKIKVQ